MDSNDQHPGGASKPGRRQAILAVAGDLFGRHGVQSVTTRQIAAQVGISQPSLYAHFASVQQIHDEIMTNAFALLEATIARTLDSGLDGHDLLKQAISSYFAFGFENPVAYRIAFMIEYPSDGEMTKAAYEAEDHPGPAAFAGLRTIVARVRPDLDAGDLDRLGKSLWASLHGLVSLMLARPAFPWGDKARLLADHGRMAYELVIKY